MNRMEDAKKKYDEIPIPEELSRRVLMEVERAGKRRKIVTMRKKWVKSSLIAAASGVIIFTAALNANTAFAKNMSEIPVIGAVARVLTFRSYETETEDLKISVEIPSVEMVAQDMKGVEASVNEEIHSLCEQYAAEAVKRAEEYRKAFLETGGTQEEWEAHNIEIKVWYEIKAHTEDYLSLAVMGTESWTTAYSETVFYNFDLKNKKRVNLQDMLGGDYKQTADDEIRRQMEERAAEGSTFWEEFEGVDENTKFYINEKENPVVVFEKYEIAPGSSGQVEFEIVQETKSV